MDSRTQAHEHDEAERAKIVGENNGYATTVEMNAGSCPVLAANEKSWYAGQANKWAIDWRSRERQFMQNCNAEYDRNR